MQIKGSTSEAITSHIVAQFSDKICFYRPEGNWTLAHRLRVNFGPKCILNMKLKIGLLDAN